AQAHIRANQARAKAAENEKYYGQEGDREYKKLLEKEAKEKWKFQWEAPAHIAEDCEIIIIITINIIRRRKEIEINYLDIIRL
ncbi:16330_t:CDS:2, partial [Gigaspora rosea]